MPPVTRIVYHYRDPLQSVLKAQKQIWEDVLKKVFDVKKIPVFEKKKTQTDGVDTYPCNKIYTSDGNMFLFRDDPEFKRKKCGNFVFIFYKTHKINMYQTMDLQKYFSIHGGVQDKKDVTCQIFKLLSQLTQAPRIAPDRFYTYLETNIFSESIPRHFYNVSSGKKNRGRWVGHITPLNQN